MTKLLVAFKQKNGFLPETVIAFRDGVSDGQFLQVVEGEVDAIRAALDSVGCLAKISFIIAQKSHNTRLVYEEKVDGHSTYINPCPGIVIDANGKENSIVSGRLTEFYLNSHIAIQGTSKPCKYSLVYDEIGFKLSELELLTYWTCYLYCRCNRSISVAAPVKYADFATKRARNLFAGGGTEADLATITDLWLEDGMATTMFFV